MHLPKEKYEDWQEYQAREKKKAGVVRFVFNKNLPRLNSYPKKISSYYAAGSSSFSSATSSVAASAVSSSAGASASASASGSSA